MSEMKLENLIEKFPENESCIIVIEDDLTEKITKFANAKENITVLEDLIKEKMGFCFCQNKEDYFCWEYIPSENVYKYHEIKERVNFYLHEKLKTDLNLSKILGKPFREEKKS